MNSFCSELGSILPENDPHGVSISLPTWSSVVGYEQGDPTVLAKLQSGYPRFRFHRSIEKLMNLLLYLYYFEGPIESSTIYGSVMSDENQQRGEESLEILVFPSQAVAKRFASFMVRRRPKSLMIASLTVVFAFYSFFQNAADDGNSKRMDVVLRQVRDSTIVVAFFPASNLRHVSSCVNSNIPDKGTDI